MLLIVAIMTPPFDCRIILTYFLSAHTNLNFNYFPDFPAKYSIITAYANKVSPLVAVLITLEANDLIESKNEAQLHIFSP